VGRPANLARLEQALNGILPITHLPRSAAKAEADQQAQFVSRQKPCISCQILQVQHARFIAAIECKWPRFLGEKDVAMLHGTDEVMGEACLTSTCLEIRSGLSPACARERSGSPGLLWCGRYGGAREKKDGASGRRLGAGTSTRYLTLLPRTGQAGRRWPVAVGDGGCTCRARLQERVWDAEKSGEGREGHLCYCLGDKLLSFSPPSTQDCRGERVTARPFTSRLGPSARRGTAPEEGIIARVRMPDIRKPGLAVL
jgi:hypothetical protein